MYMWNGREWMRMMFLCRVLHPSDLVSETSTSSSSRPPASSPEMEKFISIFIQQQQQNRERSFHSEMHLSLVADGSTVGHFDGIRRSGNKVGN